MKKRYEKNNPAWHSTTEDLDGTSDPDERPLLTPSTDAMQQFIQPGLARKYPIGLAADSRLTKLKEQLDNNLAAISDGWPSSNTT
jgi:hypothetical protein